MTTMKTVSFDPKVKIRGSLHRENYTDEEAKSCWCSPEEDQIALRSYFAEKRAASARQQNKAQKRTTTPFTLRGICRFQNIDDEDYRLEMIFHQARNAIFEEQQRQFQQQIDDPYELAIVYAEVTEEAKRIARKKGLRDQAWVLRMLEHDEKKTTKKSSPSKEQPKISTQRNSELSVSPVPASKLSPLMRASKVSQQQQQLFSIRIQ